MYCDHFGKYQMYVANIFRNTDLIMREVAKFFTQELFNFANINRSYCLLGMRAERLVSSSNLCLRQLQKSSILLSAIKLSQCQLCNFIALQIIICIRDAKINWQTFCQWTDNNIICCFVYWKSNIVHFLNNLLMNSILKPWNIEIQIIKCKR